MEFDQILDNLKKRIYHPVYFLCGEEPYYIDVISDYIEKNVLSEAEKGFDQLIFYGKDTEAVTALEAARRFPMMAAKQVIIVKEAQSWKNLEPLVKYMNIPSTSTLLVVNYKFGKPDGRTEMGKEISKKSVYLESKKLKEYQIPLWVGEFVKNRGYAIAPQASQMLTDFLGNDLSKIANELDKLFIILSPGSRISPEDVEKNIGISREYNVFELTDALGAGDVLKANRIINYSALNPKALPINVVINNVFSYFSKIFKLHFLNDKSEQNLKDKLGIHPFFAKGYLNAMRRYNKTKVFEIMGIIREYDMKSKGVESTSAVEQSDLLKEMIYKILH